MKQLKIGIGYRKPCGSNWTGSFPASLEELATFETVYETLPG